MIERVLPLGGEKTLTGVLSEPADAVSPATAFVFLNAGLIHHVGPNRIYVRLARQLANKGFFSLRFDISGIGDSEARSDGVPYFQSRVSETKEVFDYLEQRKGVERFVLLGLCSGADHAFLSALDDERVVGAVLLDGYAYRTRQFYLRRYLRRFFRAESWWDLVIGAHPIWKGVRRFLGVPVETEEDFGFVMDVPSREEAEAGLEELIRRRMRLLFVYTHAVNTTFNYAGQFYDMFPSVKPNDDIRVEFWPEVNHTFTLLSHQSRLLNTVCEWANALASWRVDPLQPEADRSSIPAVER